MSIEGPVPNLRSLHETSWETQEAGGIRVRYYRASDEKKVLDLIFASMAGDDSASVESMREQWTTRTSLICYLIVTIGILSGISSRRPVNQFIAWSFALLGGIIFALYRRTLNLSNTQYVSSCFDGDLASISNTYGMAVMDPLIPDILCPVGRGGFWVAERYNGGNPMIVGCVGLDISTTLCDETSAELRRMYVSTEYRRQGVAKLQANLEFD